MLAAGLIAAPLPHVAVAERSGAGSKAESQAEEAAERRRNSPSASGMKKCGAEWKAAKAAGKIEKGMKWPQYWSACNKRLKAAAERAIARH